MLGGWVGGCACVCLSTYVLYMHVHVCPCVRMYIRTCVEPYSKGKFTGPEHNNSVQSVPSHSISLIQ